MLKKGIFMALALSILGLGIAQAQTQPVRKKTQPVDNLSVETFLVLGNCGMCKARIEGVARQAGAQDAFWDDATQNLRVRFQPEKASLDGIQQAIARIGHDNAAYKAPDAVYEGLHFCCKYERSGRPETARELDASASPEEH